MRTAFGLTLVVLQTGSAAAQSAPDPSQKVRVAVMDLSGSALKMQMTTTGVAGQPMPPPQYQQPGTQTTVSVAIPPPAEFAHGLTEMLTTILVGSNRFTVLERSAMQQIDQEQTIGQTRTTRETAAQQGAMLGAQALITGDITAFTFNKSSIGGSVTNLVKGLGAAAERLDQTLMPEANAKQRRRRRQRRQKRQAHARIARGPRSGRDDHRGRRHRGQRLCGKRIIAHDPRRLVCLAKIARDRVYEAVIVIDDKDHSIEPASTPIASRKARALSKVSRYSVHGSDRSVTPAPTR